MLSRRFDMQTFVYPAKFQRGDKPGIVVITFRDLPEVPVPAPMAAKAALYLAMREHGTTKAQLARKLGCDEKEVRRLLDPKHPTKLPRINEALDQLGKRLVVSVEE